MRDDNGIEKYLFKVRFKLSVSFVPVFSAAAPGVVDVVAFVSSFLATGVEMLVFVLVLFGLLVFVLLAAVSVAIGSMVLFMSVVVFIALKGR